MRPTLGPAHASRAGAMLLACLLAGCDETPPASAAANAIHVIPEPSDVAPAANEAQALGLLLAVEANELALATQALSRPLERRAAAFASGMQHEHAQALAVLRQHRLQDSAQSRALEARGQATNASVALEEQPAAYRQAFLATAAADYADALAMLDAALLPAVRDAATRQYLANTRERLARRYLRAHALASGP